MQIDLNNLPGVREAISKEADIRNAAFVGVNERIGMFEVMPMSLFHLRLLAVTENPLVCGGSIPSPKELANFLWILSPDFKVGYYGWKRRRHFRKCSLAFQPPIYPWLGRARFERQTIYKMEQGTKLIAQVREYIHDTFMDSPPRKGKPSFEPSYYSADTSLCALIAREFGWPADYTMRLPLKCLFQFVNEIRRHHDSSAPMFNPKSDRALQLAVQQMN